MEGDAGTSRLNPIDTDDDSLSPEDKDEDSTAPDSGAEQADPQGDPQDPVESGEPGAHQPRGESRVGRGWLAAIAVLLVLCAGAIGAGATSRSAITATAW